MVCISCFIAPLVLFIWYKFIYPFVQPLINRFIGNYELPTPFANLACPLPKKEKTEQFVGPNGEDVSKNPCPSAPSIASEDKKEL